MGEESILSINQDLNDTAYILLYSALAENESPAGTEYSGVHSTLYG